MTRTADPDNLLLVGRVWRPHGVRGEVKVIPETDDPGRLEDLRVLYLGKSSDAASGRDVDSVRFQTSKRGLTVILKLNGVDSREDAEALRNYEVFAVTDDLPPLEEGEFFLHDLIGIDVFTDDGIHLGTVQDMIQMPAHDVLVVSRERGEDVLVPAVPEFVIEMDIDSRRLVIRPIEGLLD